MLSRQIYLIFTAAFTALLTSVSAAPDWTSPQKITDVIITNGGAIAIVPGVNNPAGCSVPTQLQVTNNSANYEAMAAALLSAHAQDKTVKLFAGSCAADGAVLIQGVWIQQQ